MRALERPARFMHGVMETTLRLDSLRHFSTWSLGWTTNSSQRISDPAEEPFEYGRYRPFEGAGHIATFLHEDGRDCRGGQSLT